MTRAWRSWWVPTVALVALLVSLGWMLVQGPHAGAWDREVRDSSRWYGSEPGHHRPMMGPSWHSEHMGPPTRP